MASASFRGASLPIKGPLPLGFESELIVSLAAFFCDVNVTLGKTLSPEAFKSDLSSVNASREDEPPASAGIRIAFNPLLSGFSTMMTGTFFRPACFAANHL